MRALERIYRALLRLYPAEFRDEYASEMAQLYHDRVGDEPPARVWTDLVGDLVRTAPKEHGHVLLADLAEDRDAVLSRVREIICQSRRPSDRAMRSSGYRPCPTERSGQPA